MGYEYIITSESTRTYYELGKGSWHNLDLTLDEKDLAVAIARHFREALFITDGPHIDEHAARMAASIFAMPSDKTVVCESSTAYDRATVTWERDDDWGDPWTRVGSRYTDRDCPAATNQALIVVAHSKVLVLEVDVETGIGEWIDGMGEADAFAEVAEWDMLPGVWVCSVDLVDDGPGDWPGSRECRLDISKVRLPTPEEWSSHLAGEYIWGTPDSGPTYPDPVSVFINHPGFFQIRKGSSVDYIENMIPISSEHWQVGCDPLGDAGHHVKWGGGATLDEALDDWDERHGTTKAIGAGAASTDPE